MCPYRENRDPLRTLAVFVHQVTRNTRVEIMADAFPPAGPPDPDPEDPGDHREMVAPHRGVSPRVLAARISRRPLWSGKPDTWKEFEYQALALFDECAIEATALDNDARKTSDEASDRTAWQDDNALVFTMLTSMIDTKIASGKTLFKMILKKFPAGTKTGDELFRYLRERGTGLTKAQVKELKEKVAEVKLQQNDTPEVWENKLVDMITNWNLIPESYRGGDETILSDMILEKVPSALSKIVATIEGICTVDEDFMEDSDRVVEKLVDLHRKTRSKTVTEKHEQGGAFLTEGDRGRAGAGACKFAGKFKGKCHVCGQVGHLAKDCKRRCRSCGLKCCGGVLGTEKCMTIS